MAITVNPKTFTLQPGQKSERFILQADYLLLQKIAPTVAVRINEGAECLAVQGRRHQGQPGAREIEVVEFRNTDALPQDVELVYGLGQLDVVGAVTILGGITLPDGAAVALKQDEQSALLALLATEAGQGDVIAGLAALLAATATAAKQDAQTALLTTLAAAGVETPDTVPVAANSNQNFANCRSIAVQNTGGVNITVTINGNARVIAPGQGRNWSVSSPFRVLATVNVAVPAGGAAEVVTTT